MVLNTSNDSLAVASSSSSLGLLGALTLFYLFMHAPPIDDYNPMPWGVNVERAPMLATMGLATCYTAVFLFSSFSRALHTSAPRGHLLCAH